MAILFADGFDLATSTDTIASKGWQFGTYQNVDAAYSTEGRSGNCIKWTHNTADTWRQSGVSVGVGNNTGTGWCQFAYKTLNISNIASTIQNAFFFGIGQSGFSSFLCLCITSAGIPYLVRIDTDDNNPTLLATASSGLSNNTWAYLECKWTIANSGSFLLKINGVTVINFSGDTLTSKTTDTTWNAIFWGGQVTPNYSQTGGITGPYISTWLDDVIIGDTTGSVNNDLIGDVSVVPLLPTGVGNSTDWTPSTGANWECVDELPNTGDTDYVATTTNDAKDLYAFPDVDATSVIKAVQVCALARKTADGPGKLALVTRSNGADYDSATQLVLTTSYGFSKAIFNTDPDTSAAWVYTAFNSAQFGMKKVAS